MKNFNLLNSLINDIKPIIAVFICIVVLVFGIANLIRKYKWSLKRIDKMKGDDFENFIKYCYELL